MNVACYFTITYSYNPPIPVAGAPDGTVGVAVGLGVDVGLAVAVGDGITVGLVVGVGD